MALVLASLLDPLFEQRLLGGGQLLRMLGRRHRFIGIGRTNASDEFTLGDIARYDGGMSLVNRSRTFGRVESQASFSRLLVRSMTGPALVGQDWTDIAVEANLARSRCRGGSVRRKDVGMEHNGCEQDARHECA